MLYIDIQSTYAFKCLMHSEYINEEGRGGNWTEKNRPNEIFDWYI